MSEYIFDKTIAIYKRLFDLRVLFVRRPFWVIPSGYYLIEFPIYESATTEHTVIHTPIWLKVFDLEKVFRKAIKRLDML